VLASRLELLHRPVVEADERGAAGALRSSA
jgi:hypothetical protein